MEVVSPGLEERDYEDKRVDYWDAGVGEYWIADPQRRCLTDLTRAGGAWRERVFQSTDTYRPEAMPGLEIPVGRPFE